MRVQKRIRIREENGFSILWNDENDFNCGSMILCIFQCYFLIHDHIYIAIKQCHTKWFKKFSKFKCNGHNFLLCGRIDQTYGGAEISTNTNAIACLKGLCGRIGQGFSFNVHFFIPHLFTDFWTTMQQRVQWWLVRW